MDSFIKEQIEQYAFEHTSPETELLQRLSEETYAKMSAPHMQVGRAAGRLLQLLLRISQASQVLEIGMFTGYSALMMAEALPNEGHLISCEINTQAAEIAKRYFHESPHGRKIEIRMGTALETIKTLDNPLDMIFIDADKANYINYYEACMPLLKPGGFMVADNTLWSGEVLQPQSQSAIAITQFNDHVQADPRVDNVCLTVRDGMTLIWKRKTT